MSPTMSFSKILQPLAEFSVLLLLHSLGKVAEASRKVKFERDDHTESNGTI